MAAYDYDAGIQFIAFEAEDLAGLVIRFRPATVDALAEIVRLTDFSPDVSMTPDELIQWQPLCAIFADLIIEWNVQQGGHLVPATAESFRRMAARWQLRVAKTWARVMVGLPEMNEPATDEIADDEPAFTEADLPMVPLEAVS